MKPIDKLSKDYWIPLCSSLNLKPIEKVRVFNRDLLIVNGNSVVNAICPHRGYNLSNGCKLSNRGSVICPYHDYHLSPNNNVPGLNMVTYPCINESGFIWTNFNSLSDSLIPSIHSLFNSKINLTISKTINCNFVDLLINLSDPIHFAAVHKNSAGLGLKHTGVNCNYYKETNEYCNYEIEWKGVKGRPKASWVYIYPPLVVIGVSLGNKDVVMVGNSLPIDDNKSNLVVNVYMDFDWWPFRYLQRYLARFMTSIVMQEDKNILESLTPDYSKYRDISPLDKPGRWIINKFS